MADNRPIGVFDSGLGGLTVVKEIIKLLPYENIVYFGDTGRVPYGTRSNNTIIKYAIQDENFLLSKNVKTIVAACGTVSSVASSTGANLPVPYIEIVSHAAYASIKATKNGNIGVIGTPATINSNSYKKIIFKADNKLNVFQNACPLFVPLVENGFIDSNDIVTTEIANRYLQPLIKNNIDTLILGCTHYPAIANTIRKIVGNNVTLINPGEYVACAVKNLLQTNNIFNNQQTAGKIEYYVSDKTDLFSATASILMDNCDMQNVYHVDIEKF